MICTAAVIVSADDSISSIAVNTPIAISLCMFESVNKFAGMVDENSVVESNVNH